MRCSLVVCRSCTSSSSLCFVCSAVCAHETAPFKLAYQTGAQSPIIVCRCMCRCEHRNQGAPQVCCTGNDVGNDVDQQVKVEQRTARELCDAL